MNAKVLIIDEILSKADETLAVFQCAKSAEKILAKIKTGEFFTPPLPLDEILKKF